MPSFSSGWDFMMGLSKHHRPANFEVAIFSRWKNIKGEPQFWEAPLAQGHAHFSSGCDFMMVLGKPKLHTKFEVPSLRCCRNVKGEPQNLGSFPSPGLRPRFSLGAILWWPLANPSCIPNLKSLLSAVTETLKGDSKILRSSPRPGSRPLFFCLGFYDGPW